MVKLITPRGVGRPDGSRFVYRTAVRTPRVKQIPFSDSIAGTIPAGYYGAYVDWTTEDLGLEEGWNLILNTVVLNLDSNVLTRLTCAVMPDNFAFAEKYSYGPINKIEIYPGFRLAAPRSLRVYIYRYEYDKDLEISIIISGIRVYVGAYE